MNRLRLVPASVVLASILVLAACGGAIEGDASRIVLERTQVDPTLWQATYHLDRPTSGLRFSRPAMFYREEVWEIVTPGWKFARGDEGDQLLVSESGDETTIQLRFPIFTDNITKEYELFEKFTDGSLAIYTGHLYVAVDSPPGEETADAVEFLNRVELVPEGDEHIVVQGEVFRGRTTWQDPHGDGTYVYFGAIEPLETASMVAVVDPGAPGWLVERMDRMLPVFFDRYTDGFNETLPWKPVVLFSFHDVDRPGMSSGGGTLTGLIQMSASGREWHDARPASSENLLYLVAHEAAHLWNGQLHNYADSADSWMHEGSADAFAELLLLESGAIDSARLAQRRTEALNHCARGLRDGPLSASGDRGQFRNYYHCGNMIAVWSVAATSAPGDSAQLFAIWRTLFEQSNSENGGYDRKTYLAALESLGAEPERVAQLREFLDAELDDPAQALIQLFQSVGVELQPTDRPIEALRRSSSRTALQHLMADSCGGRYSFNSEGDWLRTFVVEGCPAFSEEMRVVSIAGHSVGEDGDKALAAISLRCLSGQDVSLTLEDGTTVHVPCSAPAPPEPAPLAFP